MKVRSLGLAVLGVALLAGAGVLGAVLVHDGESDVPPLAAAAEGDVVAVKGRPEPFFPDDLRQWAPVRPVLREHSYLLHAEEGVVALLTSDTPVPEQVVLAAGRVVHVSPYPSDPGQLLVVIDVEEWREPLLFR